MATAPARKAAGAGRSSGRCCRGEAGLAQLAHRGAVRVGVSRCVVKQRAHIPPTGRVNRDHRFPLSRSFMNALGLEAALRVADMLPAVHRVLIAVRANKPGQQKAFALLALDAGHRANADQDERGGKDPLPLSLVVKVMAVRSVGRAEPLVPRLAPLGPRAHCVRHRRQAPPTISSRIRPRSSGPASLKPILTPMVSQTARACQLTPHRATRTRRPMRRKPLPRADHVPDGVRREASGTM